MADVRDVDAQKKLSASLFDRDRVVKIARIFAVDGNDEIAAEIAPPVGRDRLFRRARGRREHLWRKFFGQIVRADDRVLLCRQFAVSADHAFDLPLRLAAFGIGDDAHAYLFTGRRAHLASRDADGVAKPLVVGVDESAAFAALIDARQSPYAAADDRIDGGFVAAGAADGFDKDLVAVQRAAQGARGDKEVVRLRTKQKRKAAPAPLQDAAYKAELFGRNEAAALVAHDLPLLFQRAQKRGDALPLRFGRDAEQPRDLVRLFILQRAAMKLFPDPFDRCHDHTTIIAQDAEIQTSDLFFRKRKRLFARITAVSFCLCFTPRSPKLQGTGGYRTRSKGRRGRSG